jgi:hypothetical protein
MIVLCCARLPSSPQPRHGPYCAVLCCATPCHDCAVLCQVAKLATATVWALATSAIMRSTLAELGVVEVLLRAMKRTITCKVLPDAVRIRGYSELPLDAMYDSARSVMQVGNTPAGCIQPVDVLMLCTSILQYFTCFVSLVLFVLFCLYTS